MAITIDPRQIHPINICPLKKNIKDIISPNTAVMVIADS